MLGYLNTWNYPEVGLLACVIVWPMLLSELTLCRKQEVLNPLLVLPRSAQKACDLFFIYLLIFLKTTKCSPFLLALSIFQVSFPLMKLTFVMNFDYILHSIINNVIFYLFDLQSNCNLGTLNFRIPRAPTIIPHFVLSLCCKFNASFLP